MSCMLTPRLTAVGYFLTPLRGYSTENVEEPKTQTFPDRKSSSTIFFVFFRSDEGRQFILADCSGPTKSFLRRIQVSPVRRKSSAIQFMFLPAVKSRPRSNSGSFAP